MRVLFIVGNCLKVNSSANLCHLAYINGFIETGHEVDLLTASSKNQHIDESMDLPNVRNIYEYDVSLYDQLGGKKAIEAVNLQQKKFLKEDENPSKKSLMISRIKRTIRNSYGVYSTDIIWYKKAKRFRNTEVYDLVISLSFPPISHKLASYLIKKKHIKTKKCIQIWEDPWYSDLVGDYTDERVKKEENKLLHLSNKIVYVSPLTLMYQKALYPSVKENMCWFPLPSYYSVENEKLDYSKLKFGYYGDYVSKVRNLQPFYNVALKNNCYVNICGSSDLNFISKDEVSIYPRMPLNKLKPFEDETNVIVFLCNLRGGQIPGKIYQYSATNKIILFILDGTEEEQQIIKEYFSKFDRYVFCENTEKSIEQAINSIPGLLSESKYTTPLTVFNTKNIVDDIINEIGM